MHEADILKFARKVFSEGNIFDEIYVIPFLYRIECIVQYESYNTTSNNTFYKIFGVL